MRNWFVIEHEARQHQACLQRQARTRYLLHERHTAQTLLTPCADQREPARARRSNLWTMLRGAIAGLIA
jgi:hypothetical protein